MQKFVLLFLLLIFSQFEWGDFSSNKPSAPALYIFGDSLVDCGNNNWLPEAISKYNYFPYGVNFFGGHATGRATNGKIFPDFIAECLGLPYPPAYRNPDQQNSLTGYNYASAGCGILPDTGHIFGCTNLETQVRDFQSTVEKELVSSFPTRSQLLEHLSNSIFVFSVGNNDYLVNYFYPASNASSLYNPQQFAQLLTDQLSNYLQILYKMGARKAVILEMGPIGCTPYVRSNGDNQNETKCDEIKNQNATTFNNKLASTIENLTFSLSDFHLTLAKFYSLTEDALKNPAKYGLSDTRNPCCTPEANIPGCKEHSRACPNPEGYLYFDGVHPTEAMVSYLAVQCINNSSFCSPWNIQELVQAQIFSSYAHSAL